MQLLPDVLGGGDGEAAGGAVCQPGAPGLHLGPVAGRRRSVKHPPPGRLLPRVAARQPTRAQAVRTGENLKINLS